MNTSRSSSQACLLLLLFSLTLTLGSFSAAHAQGNSTTTPTSIALSIATSDAITGATVTARLTVSDGTPLPDSEVMLTSGMFAPMFARTDSKGIAWFALPEELVDGRHTLRAGYAGDAQFAPSIAVTTLFFDGHVFETTPLPRDVRVTPVAPVVDGKPGQAPETAGASALPAEPVYLIVPRLIHIQPGDTPIVSAQLVSRRGEPIIGEELVLAGDGIAEQRASTVERGIATFRLPDTLDARDYALLVVYPRQGSKGAVVAQSVLHFHVSSPGAVTEAVGTAQPVRALPTALTLRTSPSKPIGLSHPAPLAAHLGEASLAGSVLLDWGAITMLPFWPAAMPVVSSISWPHFVGSLLLIGGLALAPAFYLGGRRRSVRAAPARKARVFSLPLQAWYALRIASVGVALGLVIVLLARPAIGLFFFWRVMIPMVPLLFFVAPTLWRNICPMAALNQTPRLFRFTRAWTPPSWMQRYGYLIAISLFLVLVSTRKVLFNTNGTALAILILCSLTAAFLMGSFFRGKSGWCSSICPLLPVQRIYGQTPFVTVNHAHCDPCLGCTKNCYDLNPKNAYLADLHDDDRQFAAMRKMFVALFPGFVLAFYLIPDVPAIAVWQVYAALAAAALVSMGAFYALEGVTGATGSRLTVLFGALALNIYYWFNAATLGTLFATPAPAGFVWSLRALVLGLTLFWVYRSYKKEATFIELNLVPQTVRDPFVARPQAGGSTAATTAAAPAQSIMTVVPEGKQFAVEHNRTLLELCERHSLPIEAGCRMGLCGADPVCVVRGMENLSPIGADERTTLERLGLASTTRMACMARVRGDVEVALTPDKPDVYRSSVVAGFKYDKSVEKVVIVGNGIAGVTAADHIRRRHPRCEIHLIGRERHLLYNRMGITRLIYGRSAMQGLYLLPEQWYEDFNITCWLNTQVTTIDRQARTLTLGTGESLSYDRLILTTGSRSFVPAIEGFGMPGSFVLRTADDAMAIRAYVQENRVRTAVVAGGGLLGLEAAYGLSKLGLQVTVLERSFSLLTRQLDARGSGFLRSHLERLGIRVLMEAEVAAFHAVDGAAGRESVAFLHDGQSLACDLLLVAAGICADVDLAREMRLEVSQGIVVNEQMRTSDPYIFAAGDVAEFEGRQYGLWPVAVSQAEVAAANAVSEGGSAITTYAEAPPVTMLKVAGIDLTSMGRITAEEGDEVIVHDDEGRHLYRKLIVRDGRIEGAILLGFPLDAPGVAAAVKQRVKVTEQLDALRRGEWEWLNSLA